MGYPKNKGVQRRSDRDSGNRFGGLGRGIRLWTQDSEGRGICRAPGLACPIRIHRAHGSAGG
jgi:hypothetical protein